MAKCECRCSCVGLAVVASIILGVVAAFLRITGVITLTPAFLWVTFGIAVVYLAITLLSASGIQLSGIRKCVCSVISTLLIGILGTVLLSVVLLAISFAVTSVIGAIINGALIAFLALVLGTTACLIRCILGCASERED